MLAAGRLQPPACSRASRSGKNDIRLGLNKVDSSSDKLAVFQPLPGARCRGRARARCCLR